MRMSARLMCNGKRAISSSSFNTDAGRGAGYLIGLGASATKASASARASFVTITIWRSLYWRCLRMAALTSASVMSCIRRR